MLQQTPGLICDVTRGFHVTDVNGRESEWQLSLGHFFSNCDTNKKGNTSQQKYAVSLGLKKTLLKSSSPGVVHSSCVLKLKHGGTEANAKQIGKKMIKNMK